MNLKDAFEVYFKKLALSNKAATGYMPKVAYVKQCDLNGIYIKESLDEYGYAEWQPVLQEESHDFKKIETELGFSINPDLKSFFSTYWFMQIYGSYNGYNLFIDKIPPNCNIERFIFASYNHGNHDYMKPGEFFCIGDVDGESSEDCGLYIENGTGFVYGVDWNEASDSEYSKPFHECSFLIANSIIDLISKMEVEGV